MADNVNFPGQPAPKRGIVEDAFKILASAYGGHVEAQTKLLEQGLKDGRFKPSIGGGIEEVPLSEQPEWMKGSAELLKAYAYKSAATEKPEMMDAQTEYYKSMAFKNYAEAGDLSGMAGKAVGAATPQQRLAAKAYILGNQEVRDGIKSDLSYKSPMAQWKVKLRQRFLMSEQEIRAIEEQL